MPKIKIEREDKLDLVVNGKVFKKDAFYHVIAGEHINHAYYLKRIYQVDDNWMLKLGEHSIDIELRSNDFEESHPFSFRKCECYFLCEGYVLRSFKWI